MTNTISNPFSIIDARLSNIESLLLDIKHSPIESVKNDDKPLRLKAAADFIGVAETTLYSLVHQGKLKPLKPGGHLLFTKESLQAYLRGERPEQEVNEDPSTYLKRNKKGGIK